MNSILKWGKSKIPILARMLIHFYAEQMLLHSKTQLIFLRHRLSICSLLLNQKGPRLFCRTDRRKDEWMTNNRFMEVRCKLECVACKYECGDNSVSERDTPVTWHSHLCGAIVPIVFLVMSWHNQAIMKGSIETSHSKQVKQNLCVCIPLKWQHILYIVLYCIAIKKKEYRNNWLNEI